MTLSLGGNVTMRSFSKAEFEFEIHIFDHLLSELCCTEHVVRMIQCINI